MFVPLSLAELARIVDGTVDGSWRGVLSRVSTDTRAPLSGQHVFFALRGPRFDAHDLLPRVWSAGCGVAVVERRDVRAPEGCAVVRVASVLDALQALAGWHRAHFVGRVVAITGSNGKTITRDLLARMLRQRWRVESSPMSWNSQVGVPLALLGMSAEADVHLVECGVSRPGEMERLQRMVRPDVGVFTTVGEAHREGFGTREATAREKALLYAGLGPGTVWGPSDEALVAGALGERLAPVDCAAPAPWVDAPEGRAWSAFAKSEVLARDLALALAASAWFGVAREDALRSVSGWEPPEMRLEALQMPGGVLLINDAYTADPESVAAALRLLARERRGGRRWAVLGEMAELGARTEAAHADAGRLAASLGIEGVVGVGAAARATVEAARAAGMSDERAIACPDVETAALRLDALLRPSDTVLLKASRPMALERVAEILFSGLSPARLLVDLDAMAANVDRVRRHAGPGVGILAVLKASGYGLDSVRVARALESIGVAHLSVAYADEGAQLREGGVGLPILVQFPREGEAQKLIRFGLAVEVGTFDQLRWLTREALRAGRRVPIHLKIDTGMSRSGFGVDELEAMRAELDPRAVDVQGVMTHFAAADAPEHDAFTRAQIAVFEEAVAWLRDHGVDAPLVHACNSAGAMRFPEAHHTMVRLGLGLYGYLEGDAAMGQQPVLRMTTRVLLVRDVEPGVSVGYHRDWVATRPSRVAVVAVGYADGYPRSLSDRGWMRVGGAACPVVGRVCMDVCFLDVTEAGEVAPEDEVTVFGPGPDEPSVEQLSELAGTIPHEFLTRLSARVRRVFVGSHGFVRT